MKSFCCECDRMKRKKVLLFLFGLILTLSAFQTALAQSGNAAFMDELIDEFMQSETMNHLTDSLPEEAEEFLDGNENISEIVDGFSLTKIWQKITQTLRNQSQKPFHAFVELYAIILICALLGCFNFSFNNGSVRSYFQIIVSVLAAGLLIEPVVQSISKTVSVIGSFTFFIQTFLPVFAGTVMAAGHPAAGAAFHVLVFGMCQIASELLLAFLTPALCSYLALSICISIFPKTNLKGLVSGIKTFVGWGLGLILTVFVGVLSIQSIVAGSSDAVTVKTGKFLIGNLIPVVGNTLSDLFVAAQGCIRLVRTTLGAFGIIITTVTFLPILLEILLWYFVMNLTTLLSEIFDIREVAGVTRSIGTTLGILMGILLCYCLLIIISLTLVLVTFGLTA